MSTNLLLPEPKKQAIKKWHVAMAVIFIVGGILVISFPFWVDKFSSGMLSGLNHKGGTLLTDRAEGGGGDVIIEPPVAFQRKLPVLTGAMYPADKLTAKSVIVKDHATGFVLYRLNEYEKRPIASLTKLMSALVLLEKNPDWSSTTTVVSDDVVDTRLFAGETYTLEDMWKAALVGSSNKAILTLVDATRLTRETFVFRMNQKARELGMVDTHFTDSTGLDDTDVSTASDVVLLLEEAMKSDKIKKTLLLKEYNLYSKERGKNVHIWNTDWLLLGWVPNALADFKGGKTGYITSAGYNFAMQSGDSAGHLIDVVILGAESHEARFTEARDVTEWAFNSYHWPE